MISAIPVLPGPARKNDALFLYGAAHDLPFVIAYEEVDLEIVCGPAAKVEQEVDTAACRRDGVPISHRRGGGGTVLLGPGTVVVVVVTHRNGGEGIREIFSRIHAPLVSLLDRHGAGDVEECGLSDLAIGGRKVLGSSLYLSRRPALCFYQSSLLVNADHARMERYLRHPPREPDYRRGRGHGEFCGSLRECGLRLSCGELGRALETALREGLRIGQP